VKNTPNLRRKRARGHEELPEVPSRPVVVGTATYLWRAERNNPAPGRTVIVTNARLKGELVFIERDCCRGRRGAISPQRIREAIRFAHEHGWDRALPSPPMWIGAGGGKFDMAVQGDDVWLAPALRPMSAVEPASEDQG